MTLAVFNPWHDMALANGTPNYQPPRSALTMAEELGHLAHLWEEEGRITVWGWDPLVVHLLQRRGVPRDIMPSDEQLSIIRSLSSRQTAVKALAGMSDSFVSYWCSNEDDVATAIGNALAIAPCALLKSPWSCSGKGLMRTDQMWEGWARNILKRQGGIVVEPFYANKLHDFALEYETREGRASYLGLSLFDTTAGTYTGNILDTEEGKRQRLGLEQSALQEIVAKHLSYINKEIAPYYTGPLGIDLMLMADGNIHPCVEINLRRTMGWVALKVEKTVSLPAMFVVRPGLHYTAEVVPCNKIMLHPAL